MAVSFAGVNLIGPDPDGAVQDWFDDWLPLSDSRMFGEWPVAGGNFGTSPYYPDQRIPTPNYSRPPEPKLNSWYRPTGAARWGFGFFLADYPSLQAILAQTGSTGLPQTLTIGSPAPGGGSYSRSFQSCYLLPPHPVSAAAADPAGLWVLPIVDERWYWQFVSAANALGTSFFVNGNPTATTWVSLFGNMSVAYVQAFDTIPAQYLYPSSFFLSAAQYCNIGQFIDALAFSVGQRIIPTYPAGWQSANWQTSATRRTVNLAAAGDIGVLQGGTFSVFPSQATIVPYQVEVIFRISKNGIIIGNWSGLGYRYIKNVTPVDAGSPLTPSANIHNTATVLSTALADISISNNNANPDNAATLNALALQIAKDYYAGIWIQDSAVVGTSQWQESGYDDWVEFRPGRADGVGVQPSTRISSAPYNQQMSLMLHYDSTTWEYGERIYGTLDGNLAANGTQTITLIGTDGAKPSATTHIKVTEVLGNTVSTGAIIEAIRMGDVWAAIDPSSATAGTVIGVGACSATKTAGQTGSFVLTSGPTITATVPYGVTIATMPYLIGLANDGNYYVLNPARTFLGQFNAGPVAQGSTGTFTIYTETPIGGTPVTTGVSVTAFVGNGFCSQNKTYQCEFQFNDSTGSYEVVNPDLAFLFQYSSSIVLGGNSAVVNIFDGTPGSEADTTLQVSVYIRYGLIYKNTTYRATAIPGGAAGAYECTNPEIVVRGQCSGDTASDAASGTFTIFTGSGNGSSAGTTISTVFNASSCTIKASKTAAAHWFNDGGGWQFINGHTS